MLSLNKISFEFGGRYLYEDASWQINPGDKAGLIGANGSGKSTLLRIINGEYSTESGNITKLRNLSIGFLNQDLLSYDSEKNILDVALEAFEKQLRLHEEIEKILSRLEHEHNDELLHQLHDKQVLYESLDGYTIQHKAEELLEGLGFTTADLRRPLSEFSGGWRMRVMLAKIMLQRPDVLMLDEPTNLLDLPSIQWIEKYLREYTGTIILVSHDRYFLDRVVNKIVEIANRKITVYPGNFSFYEKEKTLRDSLQQSRFENQQDYIKSQEKLIDRFRYKASKARFAQSRIKMLDKLERVEEVASSGPVINIKFDIAQQPGKAISKIYIREKSYDTLRIFGSTESQIHRGDKIALIGANGKGKSTLLRMLNGTETFEGRIQDGYNVTKSFYAQHQLEALNLDKNLIEELQDFAPAEKENTLRALLGAFLFGGDDIMKKIKVLSGGEKARIALAKLILSKANFLILDEPTNHLDFQSVNILIQVLQEFKGTFILVSHDRFFISKIANKIWWIEDHAMKEYPGTYEEYEYSKQPQMVETTQKKTIPKVQLKESKPEKKPHAEEQKKKKKLTVQFQKLEEKIAALKSEKEKSETQLSLPEIYSDQKAFQQALSQFNTIEKELKKTTEEWEKIFEELEGAD